MTKILVVAGLLLTALGAGLLIRSGYAADADPREDYGTLFTIPWAIASAGTVLILTGCVTAYLHVRRRGRKDGTSAQ